MVVTEAQTHCGPPRLLFFGERFPKCESAMRSTEGVGIRAPVSHGETGWSFVAGSDGDVHPAPPLNVAVALLWSRTTKGAFFRRVRMHNDSARVSSWNVKQTAQNTSTKSRISTPSADTPYRKINAWKQAGKNDITAMVRYHDP